MVPEALVVLNSLRWVVTVYPHIKSLWAKASEHLRNSTEERHKMLQVLETSSLPVISLAIEKAEKSPKRQELENWLERLRDAYYKTEEAIDLLVYYQLQQKVNNERISLQRKIADRIKTGVGSFGSQSQNHILTSTEEQITEFLQTAKEYKNYHELLQDGDASDASRETIAEFKFNEKVFGRGKDIETIVSKLKEDKIAEQGPSTVSSLPVIAIIGRPGIGKTTVAKSVYNYARKEGLFDIFMWVYVPRKFKAADVINKMMKVKEMKEEFLVGHLTKQKNLPFELEDQLCSLLNKVSFNDNSPLQGLLVEIKKMLYSKKCLLVLDNFGCNKGEDKEWENFTSCLSNWGSGSKILLTTHSSKIAKHINILDDNICELNQLEDGPIFDILIYHASDGNSNMQEDRLEVVGRKIAEKLKGDPKAAEVLGAQLRKKDIMEWERLSEKDWSGDEMGSRIWSYQNLHADLQRCFAFCGLFPKGFRFGGDKLIHLWMAEGFIKPANNDTRMEDIGESYLHELVSSYFLDKREDEQGEKYYVLHDLLHALAERVCGDDCIRIEYNNDGEIPRNTRKKLSEKENIHRLSLQAGMISKVKDDICRQKDLRTLVIFEGDGTVSNKELKEILQKSKKLRVLSLPFCGIKDLPDCIGELIHLRFLDISGSPLRKLPESMCKLYHLQVFALSRCESIPKCFSTLISLRHFLTSNDTVSKICDVGRLTSIQGLSEFLVKNSDGHRLKQLENLAELRGELCIKGLENVTIKDDAVKAKMRGKEHLKSLILEWKGEERDTDDAEIFEALRPCPFLKELSVKNFSGRKLPNWLLNQNSLEHLHSLFLMGCAKIENLPSMDQCFPSCGLLCLDGVDNLKELPPFPPTLDWLTIELPLLLTFVCTDDLQMSEERKGSTSMVVKQMANYSELSEAFLPISLLTDLESHLRSIIKRLKAEAEISTSCSTKYRTFLSSMDSIGQKDLSKQELIDMWVRGMDCQLELMFNKENEAQLVLPTSLTSLMVYRGSITNQALSMSLQNLHSLSKLQLHEILTITSLPPEEVLGALKHLQSIEIVNCYLLTSFGGISALTSLKNLKLHGSCLELQESSDGSLLPSQLKYLEFEYCANVDVIIERSNLPELRTLMFWSCSIEKINITNLLELTELTIVGCSQPFVLEGLSSSPRLDILRVLECPKLCLNSPEDKYAFLPLYLAIDDLSLLRLMLSDDTISEPECLDICNVEGDSIDGEPFKYLTSLKFLSFGYCQITSLPTTMKGLANLHTLQFCDCKKLDDLTFIPENLKQLEIKDCPILEKRYRNGGRKHKKIAHIPRILFKW